MKYLLAILLTLTCSTCWATTPLPPAVQAAIDKLQADTVAYSATSGSLATAQATAAKAQGDLVALQAQASALAAAIPVDQAAVTAAIQNAFGPVLPPTPSDTHTVSILEIGQTGCGPCDDMDSILTKVRAAGVAVSRVDIDKDPTAKARWKPTATPTFVTLIDGQEGNRHVGSLTEHQLTQWFGDTKAWVLKKYPPKQ